MVKGKQRESWKNTLSNARYLQNEAKVLYKGYELYNLSVPTMKELDKMNYEDAKNLMQDLRNFKRPKDLLKKTTLGGAHVSDYESKRISRMSRQAEKKKKKLRGLIEEKEIPGLMGSEIETQTRPAPINANDIKLDDFNAVVKRLESETSKELEISRREHYYENYIKGIYNVFGDIADLDYIYKLLSRIPPDEFYVLTQSKEYLQLAFIYDTLVGLEDRYEVFISDLIETVEQYGDK